MCLPGYTPIWFRAGGGYCSGQDFEILPRLMLTPLTPPRTGSRPLARPQLSYAAHFSSGRAGECAWTAYVNSLNLGLRNQKYPRHEGILHKEDALLKTERGMWQGVWAPRGAERGSQLTEQENRASVLQT